jgi:thiosulfate reductase cytochrome b subunit
MIESSAGLVPMWMLIATGFGFIAGELCGDHRRHRQCLQQTNLELRELLEQAAADSKPIHLALKEQRGVINDIHKHLLAVSKGLEKRAS